MNLDDKKKEKIEDKEFHEEIRDQDFSRKDFVRVYAVKVTFINVNFKQSTFSSCYFRKCRFIQCDFTGSTFKETYLKGTNFIESPLKYVIFEKSPIEEGVLDTCLPSEENLARDLVRSLRVNFSQIGNYEAVNKAAAIEVQLTGQHLYNAAYSRQSYYRDKENYSGWARVVYGLRHAKWKFLDLLWGNGESFFRIISSGLFLVFLISLIFFANADITFPQAFQSTLYQFWGLQNDPRLPDLYVLVLTIGRFLLIGLFMAIMVKKLSKR